MDYNPGKKLLNTLETLGIDFGTVSPNVIEAWFDTDNIELKEFLNWISTALTEDNVIHPEEHEEYEKNHRQGLIPSDNQYDILLNEISTKYPGIFNVEESELEIDILEEELKILLEDKDKLDNILQMHESLNKKEKNLLAELEKQQVTSKIELEKAENDCFKLSSNLDEINRKLHKQIENCSDKLLEYEFPSSSTHISNLPLNKYNTHYQDIVSYFSLLDKKEFANFPELQTAVLTCSKLNRSVFRDKNKDNLDHLKHRLFKSIQNKNYNEAIKEQLQGKLSFLEKFNVYELKSSVGFKQQLQANIQIKSDHYNISTLQLENLVSEISDKYINVPSMHKAKKEVQLLQNKLYMVNEVENIFTSIFSYHTLFYFMLMINNADISISDQFFRSIHHYIANTLAKCELRMESMEHVIMHYKLFEQKSLIEKNPLIQVLLALISPNQTDVKVDMKLLNEINSVGDYSDNINKLFQFREKVRPIEKNNKLLLSYLTNGPTADVVTYPYTLYRAFTEIEKILNMQNNVICSSTEIWRDTVKQRSKDEWLKFRRQLWMYFLVQPHKVVSNIQKLKAEAQKLRSEMV